MRELTKTHKDEITKIIMKASRRIAETDGCTNATPREVDAVIEEIKVVIDREHLTRVAWARISSTPAFWRLVAAMYDQNLLDSRALLGAYIREFC